MLPPRWRDRSARAHRQHALARRAPRRGFRHPEDRDEVFIEDLNPRGGLLGGKVEKVMKEDGLSARTWRARSSTVVTVDKVDLIAGVRHRFDLLGSASHSVRKILVRDGSARPAWPSTTSSYLRPAAPVIRRSSRPISRRRGRLGIEAAEDHRHRDQQIPIQLHFISVSARQQAKKRGLNEVLFLDWEFGNRDFGPIAARIKDAETRSGLGRRHRHRRRAAPRRDEEDELPAADALLHVPGARC